MSPNTDATNNPFSPAELRLIVICFKNMKSNPEIDFEAVAEEYGYKSAAVAKQKFCVAKGKCKGKLSALPGSKPTTPKKSNSYKRKANSDLGEAVAPLKRRVKNDGKKTAKYDEEVDNELKNDLDEGEGEEKDEFKVKDEGEDDALTVDGDSA